MSNATHTPRKSSAADMARCDFQEYLIYCNHPDCVCGGGSDSSGMVQGDSRRDVAKVFKSVGWTWSSKYGWCCGEAPR